jgi:hypothetical protein
MYGYGYSYPNNPQGNGLLGQYEAGVRSDGGSFAFPIDTGLASRLEGLGLLNASSLVNSCNAGKESVLYNLIPTPVQALDRFTVVRAGTKWVLNSSGVLAEVANNVPAFEFNTDGTYRGLLVEPGGTNQIRNNTGVGAVVGTPGTLPTNWTQANTGGLSSEIVAIGTEAGVEYIDIRISGTATSTTSRLLTFDSTTQIVASSGQIWTHSLWVKKIAEPNPPSAYEFGFREGTAAGALVAFQVGALALTSSWQRLSRTGVGLNVSTERVQPLLAFTITNGATYDFTIRIGLPQMEQSAVATSVIKTTGSTANRVADSVTLTGASSLIGQSAGSIFCEFVSGDFNSTTLRNVLSINDNSTQNRITIRAVQSQNNRFETIVVTGNSLVAAIGQGSNNANGATIKLALAYALNDIAFYANGASVGTDTSATIPACDRINLGNFLGDGQFINGWIRSVALFPTRLPDATLASLTA